MSQENVEIVQRCYEQWNKPDPSGSQWDLWGEDAELDMSRNVFNPAVYRGRSRLREFTKGIDEVWDAFEMRLDEVIDAGEHLVAVTTVSGRGKGSNIPVEMVVYSVWTVSGGRVVRVIGGFRDRADAYKAVGLAD